MRGSNYGGIMTKKRKKKRTNYVNNARLREVLIDYNNMNIHDNGEWCDGYKRRLKNKFSNNKIAEDKFDISKNFILQKKEKICNLQKEYENMSTEEKKSFDKKLSSLKEELSVYVIDIIKGRINSFMLHSTLQNTDDIMDITQDAYISVFKYLNRYNSNIKTSAFAYITQLATNSIIFSLNQIKERERICVTGIDYIENINTIAEPSSAENLRKNSFEMEML